MAWQKLHTRIRWENYPSDKTPLNEYNLNKEDIAIDGIDDRVILLDATKVDKSEIQHLVKDIEYDEDTGIFKITLYNDSYYELDTLLEKLAVNFDYDYLTQQLIITLSDGEIKYVDLSALITQYEFIDSETIKFIIPLRNENAFDEFWDGQVIDIANIGTKGKVFKRIIIESSVGISNISGTYQKEINGEDIQINFTSMPVGQNNNFAAVFVGGAVSYEIHCETEEDISSGDKKIIGYYAKNGFVSAEVKKGSITEEHLRPDYLADIKLEQAKAEQSAGLAATSASIAMQQVILAESWVHGGTGEREGEDEDNSKYWSEQSKEYAKGWRGSLLPQGTIEFFELPTEGMEKGYLYNISNAFVTDSRFEEGAGYSYPAGTNVYWNKSEHWDCLSGTLTKVLTQAEYDALPEEEKMNGTIYYIPDGDNAIPDATDTERGLVIVDAELSEESENPVQNKVIAVALKALETGGIVIDKNTIVENKDKKIEVPAVQRTYKSVLSKDETVALEIDNFTELIDYDVLIATCVSDMQDVSAIDKINGASETLPLLKPANFSANMTYLLTYYDGKIYTSQSEIREVFQSVSEGKSLIASAITDKGVQTDATDTFADMAENISNIPSAANPKLQSKSATLKTTSQTIKADSGYDGLSQVTVPAVSGTAAASDVVSGKTFSSANGVGISGSMPKTTGNTRAGGYFKDGSSTRYINLYIPSNGYYTTAASIYMSLDSCGLTEGGSSGGSTYKYRAFAAGSGTAETINLGFTPSKIFICRSGDGGSINAVIYIYDSAISQTQYKFCTANNKPASRAFDNNFKLSGNSMTIGSAIARKTTQWAYLAVA